MRKRVKFLAITVFFLSYATKCVAIEYQPFDWVPLPPGTSVSMNYLSFGQHKEFNNTIAGTFDRRTSLDSTAVVSRYLYYNAVNGHPFVVDALISAGVLSNAKVDGASMKTARGFGDPILSAGIWLISDPSQHRYVSIADFVSVPVGKYDRQSQLNIGSNRWQSDVQIDYTEKFGRRFTFDASLDRVFYGNKKNSANEGRVITQEHTTNLYFWVSYDLPDYVHNEVAYLRNSSVSLGISENFGGVEKSNGIPTGIETSARQIKLSYMAFTSPTWQTLLSINHDTQSRGQFKQNFNLTLRLSKLL